MYSCFVMKEYFRIRMKLILLVNLRFNLDKLERVASFEHICGKMSSLLVTGPICINKSMDKSFVHGK